MNSTPQPNNQSTPQNPVGRFMVASGAVIELENTGLILLLQRAATLDWQAGSWEIPYGRINQFEDTVAGLRREIKEEVGITDLTIIQLLSVWHIFRGTAEIAENEVIGVTYHCSTTQKKPILSAEHQNFAWVTPQEALDRIKVAGIRKDIEKYMQR